MTQRPPEQPPARAGRRSSSLPRLLLALTLGLGLLGLLASGAAAPRDLSSIWQPGSDGLRPAVLTGLEAPPRAAPTGAPNLVLVTVDTWRADRLGLYGAARDTSPWLQSLAQDSVVFERAVATSSWTWPTMVSVATGLYPGRHGVALPEGALCSEATTLAESLHAGGWRTGFAGSNQYFEPADNGYRQGFEYYWAAGSEDFERVLEYVDYFLKGASEEPFFLHVHLFDPHCPYDPSPEALAAVKQKPGPPRALAAGETIPDLPVTLALQHLCHVVPPLDPNIHNLKEEDFRSSTAVQDYLDYYDGELLETDRGLDQLAQLLGRSGDWENSWVVITGDHGEEFNEHGRLGHGDNLYSETTWVPLLIRPPGGLKGGGRRIAAPVSLVDLAPTLLDAVGLSPPDGLDGQSLLGAVQGSSTPSHTVFAETRYRYGEPWWMVERGDRRLLIDSARRRAELHSRDDLLDRHDLLTGPPSLTESVRAASLAASVHHERLRQAAAPVCQDSVQAMDPEHKERLRSLGYTSD